MNRQVAIIHFNTPMLTEAAIMSLWKHGGMGYQVTVFDNSDRYPFTKQMHGVTVIDNTKGQIIDFDRELAKYPDKCPAIGVAKNCNYGSVKHMMTVQKLWELLPDGFVLMESDILLKQGIEEFFRPEYSIVGYVQKAQPYNPFKIGRVLPMLCWMNVPMFRREGAMYFDPQRSYGLLPGGKKNRNNWYDTGAVLLEEILTKRPRLKGLHKDIRGYLEHYGSASWKNNSTLEHSAWLHFYRKLWQIKPAKVAVCGIVRNENRYLKEWTEHYLGMGVERIFLYDNGHGDDDRPQDVLNDQRIEIIDWRDRDGNTQCEAYEDCYSRHGGSYDWMGFLDADELVKTDGCSLTELFSCTQADVVAMTWRMMTDSGLVRYEDRPMNERFTVPMKDRYPEANFVKSFVRGGIHGLRFGRDPHMPHVPSLKVVNPDGGKAPQSSVGTGSRKVAWIDHYFTKTAEEYIAKISRGWPAIEDARIKEKRAGAMGYFFSINERTPEKEEILGISKPKTKNRRKRKD